MSEPLLLVLMALAAFRLWRFVGADTFRPLAWFRELLERILPGWLYDGVECPHCLGTWSAFATVAVVDQWFQPLPMPVAWGLATAALVGLIGSNLDD